MTNYSNIISTALTLVIATFGQQLHSVSKQNQKKLPECHILHFSQGHFVPVSPAVLLCLGLGAASCWGTADYVATALCVHPLGTHYVTVVSVPQIVLGYHLLGGSQGHQLNPGSSLTFSLFVVQCTRQKVQDMPVCQFLLVLFTNIMQLLASCSYLKFN